MLELQVVREQEKEMLYNIFQKYLYEMTNYYDDEMNDQGNYSYKYFDDYFIEPNRKALFIIYNGKVAGFVMLNNHSYISENPDYVIAEFSVFPIYRSQGIAKEAIDLVFSQYLGKWELKFSLKNKFATKFWYKVTEKFNPVIYNLKNEEVFLFETN